MKKRQFNEKYAKNYGTMAAAEKAMAKLSTKVGDFNWVPTVGNKGRIVPVVIVTSLEHPSDMASICHYGHPVIG